MEMRGTRDRPPRPDLRGSALHADGSAWPGSRIQRPASERQGSRDALRLHRKWASLFAWYPSFSNSIKEMRDKSLAHAVSGIAPYNGLDALLKTMMGRYGVGKASGYRRIPWGHPFSGRATRGSRVLERKVSGRGEIQRDAGNK